MGPAEQLADNSVDPNVTIPRHVLDAAAAADQLHKQIYQPEPNPEAHAEPPITLQQPPETTQAVETPPQPAAVTATVTPPTNDYAAPATPTQVQSDDWAARYNSMHGRWQASQRQIGIMQQQMSDMATELNRMNQLLGQHSGTAQPQQPAKPGGVTEEERETYGDDLLNVTRKVALDAVKPEMERLNRENADLKKRVITQDQRGLYATLARSLPNWRAINDSAEWKSWLSLPNIYTNEVRGITLNKAFAAANAPVVVQLFRDFVQEVMATGGTVPGTQAEQQEAPPVITAPRTPAMSLEAIAAPGRARPAGDNGSSQPAEKPIYTRQQLNNFYRDTRRMQVGQGPYVGREAEVAAIERDIEAAMREGRIR